MSGPIAKQAVVIGAGMGGLCAAKAVAPFFEAVTVLERDALPQTPSPRTGTPQDRQLRASRRRKPRSGKPIWRH